MDTMETLIPWKLGYHGNWDRMEAGMQWKLEWMEAGMGWKLGRQCLGYRGPLVLLTSLQARGSPAQGWLHPTHLGNLGMHEPHACLCSGGLSATAHPPHTPTSPLIKAANLIRAAPRCSRPVGAHQSPRGARVGGRRTGSAITQVKKTSL